MSKSSKFILIVFLVLAIAIIGSAHKLFNRQYNNKSDVPIPDYMNKPTENIQEDFPEEETPEEIPEEEILKNEESSDDLFIEVTNQDCTNKCSRFKNDAENLKYCQNFCGLSSINKKTTSCDVLESLEKDYCLKNTAITKKSFASCEEIIDSGIKKTCKNRVAEELLSEDKTQTTIIN